jgi:tetratricopeptide (TPR) repeat protein
MNDVSTADLVLAALAGDEGAEGGGGGGRSLAALATVVSDGGERLSRQVEVATTVGELADRELIERVGDADGLGVRPTSAGRERGADNRSQLAETTVTVVDGAERRERTLDEVAATTDRSLVGVAAECSADGVYVLGERPTGSGIVGRDAERERFDDVLAAVRDAGAGLLAVSGAGGVGKTTVVDAWLADLPADVETARVRCEPEGEPYRPLREALGAVGAADPFTADGVDPSDPETFEAQRAALFHDVTDGLVPDDGPRVVLFDDVDDADPATRRYLAALGERVAAGPLLVVCTARPDGLPDEESRIGAEWPSELVEHVTLAGLDRAGTEQLIERRLDRRGVPAAFADAVHERTDGTPLFVEATVDALLESSQLDPGFQWYPEDADAIDLPAEVRETVRRGLDGLGDDARDVLSWVAVAGGAVPGDVLADLASEGSGGDGGALAALAALPALDRTGDGRVRLLSNVVRETVLDEMAPPERRERHRAIAERLEAVADGGGAAAGVEERAATLAGHYEQAGDAEAALEWYETAAERATAVYAHETAADHLHRVLDVARDGDATETLLWAGHRLAEVSLTVGEYDRAERYVTFVRERTPPDDEARHARSGRLAASLAQARGDHEAAVAAATEGLESATRQDREYCRLLTVRAEAERDLGDYDAAVETGEELREVAERRDAADFRAEALHQLGVVALERSEYDAAHERLERALETALDAEDRGRAADVRNALGVVAKRTGSLERAADHWTAAREDYEAVGDRHQTAKVANNLGLVAKDRGDYDAALTQYRGAQAELERVGDVATAALVRMNRGNVAELRGEFERAREWLTGAVDAFEAAGRSHHAAVARLNLGNLLTTLGAYDAGADLLDDALSVTRDVEDTLREGQIQGERGRLAGYRGDVDAAGERFEAALAAAEAVGDEQLRARTRGDRARVRYRAEDLDGATADCEAALSTVRDLGDDRQRARIALTRADVAVAREACDVAEAHCETADDVYVADGDAYGRAKVSRTRGDLAAARGADPTDDWAAALETFEAVGAHRDAVETLARLADVEATAEREDWHERARGLLAAAPAAVGDAHGDWVA